MQPEDRMRLNRFLMSQQAAPVLAPDKKSARSVAQPSVPTPAEPAEELLFERELKQLVEFAQKGTYYSFSESRPNRLGADPLFR